MTAAVNTQTPISTDNIQITGGPSASQIWDAAKFAFSNKFTVFFEGQRTRGDFSNKVRFEAQIIGVMHEDGSNDSFILTANIVSYRDDSAFRGTKTFYYKARRHSGFLDLTK